MARAGTLRLLGTATAALAGAADWRFAFVLRVERLFWRLPGAQVGNKKALPCWQRLCAGD